MLHSCLEEILISNRATSTKSHRGMEMLPSFGTLPVHIFGMAHACVVVREVMGELDGEFEDDAKGAVQCAGGE